MISVCDSCSKVKKVKRLDTGGGSGIFLCFKCWIKEIQARIEANQQVCNPFDIVSWRKQP